VLLQWVPTARRTRWLSADHVASEVLHGGIRRLSATLFFVTSEHVDNDLPAKFATIEARLAFLERQQPHFGLLHCGAIPRRIAPDR
jgi:hypothetical protein